MSSQRSLEQQYYEFDGFWNPATTPLGEFDQKRAKDIFQAVPQSAQSILDVGCGNGVFCNYARQQNPALKLMGLDRSRTALKYVSVTAAQGSVTSLPYLNQAVECVTVLEVLEHLPQSVYEAARREIARVAGKYIIVTVPNNQDLEKTQTQCPACKTRFDPDLHMRSFTTEAVRDLFIEYGFSCQQVEAIGWYSNYIGIGTYSKWRRRGLKPTMASPLCPICGFTNDMFLQNSNLPLPVATAQPSANILVTVKGEVKKLWPLTQRSRWLLGLYRREGAFSVG
jgi:cyclopropane fatty-acyl-phospholipid synthase-like methyltransferase